MIEIPYEPHYTPNSTVNGLTISRWIGWDDAPGYECCLEMSRIKQAEGDGYTHFIRVSPVLDKRVRLLFLK